MRTILLTGASGYLGRNLATALLKNGYKLVVIVRANSDVSYLNNIDGQVKVYRANNYSLDTIFSENSIDIIIHTAANYGRKSEPLTAVIEANLFFPISLLDVAIKYQVKYFVNTDTALPKTLNWYSKSKKQFLEWLEFSSLQINVLNLQLEYFYGPNDDDSKFITFLLRELQSGKTSIDFTSATSLRDFIFIKDVVEAYLLLISQIHCFEGIKNVEIGTGNAEALKELVVKVRSLLLKEHVTLNFGALPTRNNEIARSCADITFLKSIGWEPKYTFEEGILETIKIEKII